MADKAEISETGEALDTPESVDVAGAVELMAPEAEEDPGEEAGSVPEEEGADEAEPAAEEPDDSPEFWSAEDRAAWKAVPSELRPVLKKYEQQRIEFVNQRTREAAEQVRAAHGAIDQGAAWWQQVAPAFEHMFGDRWSRVNWAELAEKNPAEWARLQQMRQDEGAILAEADRRGRADIAAANKRAEEALQEQKAHEHAKLAARLPEYFGPESAARTYDELGKWLFAKGIPADRINAIHEAAIIELALNAWRFELAQKKASTVRVAASTTARTAPARVVPGPASHAGNRSSDAARQARARFEASGGSSIADAAELIRLNGL